MLRRFIRDWSVLGFMPKILAAAPAEIVLINDKEGLRRIRAILKPYRSELRVPIASIDDGFKYSLSGKMQECILYMLTLWDPSGKRFPWPILRSVRRKNREIRER